MTAICHKSRRIGNEGQTLVEFALVVALFLAIVFGIVEFGRLWFYSNHLNNSVRAAARYAAVLGSTDSDFGKTGDRSDVINYATSEVEKTMDPVQIADITVLVNGSATATPNRGDNIQVIITYNFHVLSGSIIPFFNGDYTLVRSATMRYEG